MKTLFYSIISLNTIFKYIDWLLLIIGLYLFSSTASKNFFEAILMTVIGFLIVIWLGRYIASILVLIASIPLFITTFISNHLFNRYNDEKLTNDLVKIDFIMVAVSMLCYGMICSWLFLSQKYNTSEFYHGLFSLYIAVMFPSMMIIENHKDVEKHAFDLFGSVWTFFYRIAFLIGIIAVAVFNVSVFSILIIVAIGLFLPIKIFLYKLERE